jgi:hypothetical protein
MGGMSRLGGLIGWSYQRHVGGLLVFYLRDLASVQHTVTCISVRAFVTYKTHFG